MVLTSNMIVSTYSQLAERVEQEIGCSDWIVIDQNLINGFAKLTGDNGFVHVDPVAAAATTFGSTIAHGLLVLSLTPAMAKEALPQISDRAYLLNYGYDKVRMIAPIHCDAAVRGRFRLRGVAERGEKQRLLRYAVEVEMQGKSGPVLVADWLMMVVLK